MECPLAPTMAIFLLGHMETISRFTCPERAILFSSSFRGFFFFFFADSKRRNGFQPVKSLYFCVDQQKKKELLEKNQ